MRPISAQRGRAAASRARVVDVVAFKFMKKLGLKKPDFLPDFGKPKGLGESKASTEKVYSDVTASQMWAVLKAWDAPYIAKGSGAEVASTSGSGVGAMRVIKFGEAQFDEELILCDDAKMAFAYTIPNDDAPFPMKNYGAKCYVMDTNDGGCSVTWTGWCDVTEGTIEDLKLNELFDGFIDAAHDMAVAK